MNRVLEAIRRHQRTFFRGALLFAISMYIAQMISLPVGISYDGHIYIDMADVLFSSRFPAQWVAFRTPLYPLSLKVSFWFFGRQPIAIIAVSSIAAIAGIILLVVIVRRLVGDLAGGLAVILLALDPNLVSYAHYALTETGIFAFLVLAIAFLLLVPEKHWRLWLKALGLAAIIAMGWYWRQYLISLAWPCALLLGLRQWSSASREYSVAGAGESQRNPRTWTWIGRIVGPILIVGIMPSIATFPFRHFVNPAITELMTDIMLKNGIFKQALTAPEDPFVGTHRDEYVRAIQDSRFGGHLYSGLRARFTGSLANEVFSQPGAPTGHQAFVALVKKYPKRYFRGVWRNLMLFFGARGSEDEIEITRATILSRGWTEAPVGGGPEPISSADKAVFSERAVDSFVRDLYRSLYSLYDFLLPIGFIFLFIGLVAACVWRQWNLFAFCFLPFIYLLPMALVLTSIDRYGLPTHPVALVSIFVVPIYLVRIVVRERQIGLSRRAMHEPRESAVGVHS